MEEFEQLPLANFMATALTVDQFIEDEENEVEPERNDAGDAIPLLRNSALPPLDREVSAGVVSESDDDSEAGVKTAASLSIKTLAMHPD